MRLIAGILFASSCLWAAAYTATQSGDPTSNATWGGGGHPGYGDTWNAGNYTLTLPFGETWQTGTCHASFSGATVDGEIGATGTLTINGTLAVRGNIRFDGVLFDGTNNHWNQGPGSVITSDCTTGDNTVFFPQVTGHYTVISWGVSGTPFKTVAQYNASAGNNVRVTNTGGGRITLWHQQATNYSNFTGTMYGVVIDQCGTSALACIEWGPGVAFGFNPTLDAENVSFDSGGEAINQGTKSNGNPNASWILRGVQVTNSLDAYSDFNIFNGGLALTGTKILDRVYGRFGGPPNTDFSTGSSCLSGFTITNVVFADFNGCQGVGSTVDLWNWTSALLHMTSCNQSDRSPSAIGFMFNTYALCDGGQGGNTVVLALASGDGTGIYLDTGCIHCVVDMQDPGASKYNNHCFTALGGSVTNAFNRVFSDVVITAHNADAPFISHACQSSAWNLSGSSPVFSITNISSPAQISPAPAGSTGPSPFFFLGESGRTLTANNTITLKYIANGSTGYASQNLLAAVNLETSMVANVIPPANIDNNVVWGYVPVTTWTSGYNANCNPCTSNGTPYSYPSTGTAGVHDLHVDPQWLDPARDAFKWAITQGQAGTAAGVLAAFTTGGPDTYAFQLASLTNWVRAGFTPQNKAVWNAFPVTTQTFTNSLSGQSTTVNMGGTPGAVQPVMFPMPGIMRTVNQ